MRLPVGKAWCSCAARCHFSETDSRMGHARFSRFLSSYEGQVPLRRRWGTVIDAAHYCAFVQLSYKVCWVESNSNCVSASPRTRFRQCSVKLE